ncbi:MAG: universal stress protein A [Curvibacter sp. PD_MW3]|nr:MAG: universal stress protein A [Curvibacter sp. PD_MW3]
MKINTDNKVLACVDQSRFAETVADYAAWAAQRMGAPLELLHVIERHPEFSTSQDHSGAIGLGAQDSLLDQLSNEDEVRSRSQREAGRVFLNHLHKRAQAAGVAVVDMRQRHGDLAETLADQQAEVRLFVLGRRGASAELSQRDLGRNLEWVVRAVERPILAVKESYQEPTRVLLAFDGSSVTRRGVEMIAASPLLKGLPIHVLMAGKPQAQGPKQIEWAQQTLTEAGFMVTAEIVDGDPESVINRTAQQGGHDLLVMGAYSHSPLRSLLLGSKTSELLRSSKMATLLLR